LTKARGLEGGKNTKTKIGPKSREQTSWTLERKNVKKRNENTGVRGEGVPLQISTVLGGNQGITSRTKIVGGEGICYDGLKGRQLRMENHYEEGPSVRRRKVHERSPGTRNQEANLCWGRAKIFFEEEGADGEKGRPCRASTKRCLRTSSKKERTKKSLRRDESASWSRKGPWNPAQGKDPGPMIRGKNRLGTPQKKKSEKKSKGRRSLGRVPHS